MAYGGKIQYDISFKADQVSLNEIKRELETISKLSATQIKMENPSLSMGEAIGAMKKVRTAIDEIKPALNSAFDTTTGVVNLEKLRSSLKKLDLKDIQSRFNAIGPQGEQAFFNISKAALTTNVNLKQTSHLIDKMGQTLINTIKWSFSSSIINNFTGAVQQAYGYVQHLDTSLNDIRIVTGKSAEEMDKFAIKANDAAKALGASTTEYTEASLIYYQQGLGDEEAQARAETTLKAANVTGQTGRQVSEELTAVWNGYKVTAEETEQYVDKLAAVAATTASNLEELSTGMSKVASAANNMGVNVDQLNGMLATIISVTRQAPETAGTALKTIFARMEDLKISGEDEYGVKLGQVSGTLNEVGVQIMDTAGNMRDLGEVIEEVGNKWDSWTRAQQSAIAQSIAGKRQYNNLLALFDNWNMYNQAVATSENSLGTLQKQQDTYMESTAAHLEQLKTEWEDLYDSVLDTKDLNKLIDGLTNVLNLVTNIIDAVGGGRAIFTGLIALVSTKFSKQIAEAFAPLIINMKNAKENAETLGLILKNIDLQQKEGVIGGKAASAMSEAQREMSQYWDLMDEGQINATQQTIREIGAWTDKIEKIETAQDAVRSFITENEKAGKTAKGIFSSDDLFSVGSKSNLEGVNFFQDKIDDIEQAQQAFENLNNTIDKVSSNIRAGNLSSNSDLKNYNIQIQEAEHELKRLQGLADKGFIPEEVVKKAADHLDIVKQKFKNLSNQINEIKTTSKAIDELKKKIEKTTDQDELDKLLQELDVLSEKLQFLKNDLSGNREGNFIFTEAEIAKLPRINGELDKTSAKYKEYIELLQKSGYSAEEAAAKIEELDLSLKKNDLAIQKRIQNISQLIGGFTSLAFAIQSLSNIKDIFDNDDLSSTEKFGQIITSLTIGIPMLISAVGALKKSLVSLLVPKAANIMADKGELEASVALKVAKYGEAAATDAETAATIRERAAKLLLNPVLIITTAALVALGAALYYSAKAHEKEIEATKQANEAAIESNKVKQEELEKNKELAKSFEELVNTYKEGTISQEEFYNKKAQLLMAMNEEARIALNTANNWKEAQEALADYRAEVAKQQKETHQESAEETFEYVLTAGDTGAGNYNSRTGIFSNEFTVTDKPSIDALRDRMAQQGYNLDDIGTLITEYGPNGETITTFRVSIDKTKDLDVFLNFVQAVKDIQKEGIYNIPTAIWNDVQEWSKSDKFKDLKAEREAVDIAAAEEAGHASGIDIATTIEQGKQAYENFKKHLVEDEGYTLDQAQEAWTTYLSGLDTEIAKQMSQTEANFTQMTYELSSNFEGDFNSTKYAENARKILEQLEDAGLSSGIHLIDPEEWKQMLLSDTDITVIIQRIREELQANLYRTFDDFKAELTTVTNNMQQLISEGINGKVDTSDKGVYQSLKDDVQDLIKYYPELTEQANTFLNEGIIGTEKWTQAVYDLQAAFDTLELDNLVNNYSSSLEKLHNQLKQAQEYTPEYDDRGNLINPTETVYDDRGFATSEVQIKVIPDTEQFTETVNEIINADYAINMEVHADITDDFDNIVQSMEKMDSMASKIGEDFIVSAEDITEIAESYPGILQDYVDLGNGTIQLNEEIAKSAMNAASEAEIASTEELKNEIENTNKKLRVKQNHYKTIISLATKGAEDEANAEKYKTEIATELDKIEIVNNDLKSQEIVDNALSVADDSAKNAQIVSDNWQNAYQNMADASTEAARIAIDNAKQVVAANRGEDAAPVKGNVKTNWSGEQGTKTTIDTTTPNLQKTDESNKDYFNRIKQMAQDSYDALEKEINANEAMKIEAIARLNKSVTNNSNAGKPKETASSGSSSAKEAKHEDYLEREVDLYREVNAQLKQIESTLSRIQKQNNYKWGKDLQKGLERENKLLDKQLDKLKEKKKIQEKDIAQQRANLEQEGIRFSKDGSSMSNTESKLNELYSTYNSMVDKYNSMTADQQESYKETLDKQKEYIDKIEKAIDKYESSFSDYQSTLDQLLELHYQQIENAVNSFNNMVDVHLELDEARKEWSDFWFEVVEDVDDTDFAGKIAQSISKLQTLIGFGDKAAQSTISVLTEHLNATVDEVQQQIASRKRGGEDSLFGDATKLSKENLEKYRDQLMDALREAKEEVDNISENYLKMLDSAQEKIDKQVEGWESIGDHLEHNVELIKLLDGEDAYSALTKQYDKIYDNDKELLLTQRQSQEFWKEQIQRYEDLLKVTDKSSVQWKTYSDGLEKASENYKKAVADLDKTIEKAIKDLQTWRENQVNSIIDTLDKAMSGGLGVDLVEQEWELITDLSSKYLDNVERAYSMEEYALDLEDAANAIGLSAENQEKLNKFREEELRKLNEKEKLTQYDIDESRARLEIMKQEMALEEARENKSNMRLRRDSQGNYTYQYVGSEEDENAGERGVLTAKREWYELVKKRYKEAADWIIELQKQQTTLHREIADAEAVGDTERANKLRELYETNAKAIQDAYAEAGKNVQDIYSGVAQYFSNVNNATILPESKATVRTLIDEWAGGGKDSFTGAVDKAITDLQGVQEEYASRTKEILELAGVEYKELAENGIDPTTESLQELVDTNKELHEQLDEINQQLDDEEKLLRAVEDAYDSLKDAAVDALEAANSALETLAQTAIDTQQKVAASVAAAQAAANASSAPSSGPGGGGTGPGGPGGSTSDYTVVTTGSGTLAVVNKRTPSVYIEMIPNVSHSQQTDAVKKLLKNKYNISSYKTGGYTGDWGGEDGRMAILHKKELVLNETDTSNLLKAVYALRDVVATKTNMGGIADQLVAAGNMQAQILAQVGTGILSSLASITTENANTSYRNMTVNADFSGVRSADAIYQALMELENYGMQNSYSVAPHMNTSF